MPKEKTDVMKLWFLAAEELGEFIGIRFARIAPGATEPEWMFPRHADYDGVGWFAENLRRRGAMLERLPTIRHPASPSKLALLQILPKYLKPKHRLKWRPLERGSAAPNLSGPPSAVAWQLFDEEATMQIRRVCRNLEVTVNSFLLKHLTKAIRPFLEDQSAAVPWMIPINLRGKVKQVRETANYTSYIRTEVQSYETVHDIHRKIYAALCRGEHWANWQTFQLGRFLTAGMRRYLVATELATPQWNLGAFSNMGDWDPNKEINQPECLVGWLFCPPVLRFQQVGVGCMTFQNRLSLTIQTHPELTTDPKVPQTWIQDWVKEIEMDVASILKPLTGEPAWS
ncbi:MAG: hypothetical protein WBW41_09435 [Verrucomicrobiia bacterium]